MHILELGIAYYVSHREVNGFYNLPPKIRKDICCQLLSLCILDKSEAFAGKEKSFREERLEAIQKKEEEKWKRRSLPSAQVISLLLYNIIIII